MYGNAGARANPQSIINACFTLLKPNGVLVLSTMIWRPKITCFAVIGAEYLLRLLPRRGTRDYEKFVTPAELIVLLSVQAASVKI